MGLVENTPTGKLAYNTKSAFVAFERDMIVECTPESKVMTK